MQVEEKTSVNDITIPDIYYENKLEEHNIYYQLIEKIANKIIKIPNFINLKNEIELVKTVCNIIENSIKSGNRKRSNPINKRQLVIDVFQRVYNLNDLEKITLGSMIDFLFNNKHIKKFSYHKLIFNFFSKYIH